MRARFARRKFSGLAPLGLALTAVLAGCQKANPPMDTLAPKSDFANWIYGLFVEVTAWDLFILLIVVVAFVLAVFVFSRRDGEAEAASTVHTDMRLELAWTLGPAFILLMISIPTIRTIFREELPAPPANSLKVSVIAHQWWWEFRYPGTSIVTANELHIPEHRPIWVSLRTADVIHSFWVPALGGKRDVIPGQINHLWFIANTPGEYYGQCAEFCGDSHANMRFRVFVDTPEQFAAWEKNQEAGPVQPASGTAAAKGAAIFANSPCTACHTITGVSKGYIGPNLTHIATRTTIAGAIMKNDPKDLKAWIENPDALKPGANMPTLGLRGPELDNLVAYLESLK
jgi:cytochrome c oxidase subunit 2